MEELEWYKKLVEGAKKNIKKFRKKIAQLQEELRKITDNYWDIYNKSLELEDKLLKEKRNSKRLENKIEAQNAIISDLIKIIEDEKIEIKLRKPKRASIVEEDNTIIKADKKNKYKKDTESEVKDKDSELRKLVKEAIKKNLDIYA